MGGGAAGFAAADMLRRQGYGGSLAILGEEAAPPVDRPNLSKDYLAGTAPEEWVPLRPQAWYARRGIELRTGTSVTAIDVRAREVAAVLEEDAQIMSNTQLDALLAEQPEDIQDEIIRINTEARPISLQVALLVPLIAGLLGLVTSFRMVRLGDTKPSASLEGVGFG